MPEKIKNRKKISHKPDSSRKIFLIPLFLILIVGIVVSVIQTQNTQQTDTLAGVPKDCSVEPAKLSYSPPEQIMLDKINAFRQSNNVPPLTSNLTLKQAASWMGKDLQTRRILVHTDSLGRDTPTRFSDCGLPFPSVVAEIIDSGDSDPNAIIGAWSHSPSQSNRLLNKNFTQVGVALVTGYNETDSYWSVTLSGPDIKPTVTYATNPYPTNPTGNPNDPNDPNNPNNPNNPNDPNNPNNPNNPNIPGNRATPTPGSGRTPTPSPTRTPSPTPTSSVPAATPTIPPTPTPKNPPHPFGTPTLTPIPIPGKGTPNPKENCNKPPLRVIDPKFVKNPADTQAFISVKFPGIGCDGNRTPKHQTRRIQATLFDVENQEVKVGTADLVFDGNFFRGTMHLGKIPDGIYSLKLSGVRTLTKVIEPQFQQFSSQKLNVMPELIIRTGDVSEDNSLTLLDYNLSLACFQDKKCKADAIEFVDFNDSGTADVIDYNILLQAFYQLSGD